MSAAGSQSVLTSVVRRRLEHLRRYLPVVVAVTVLITALSAYSAFSAGDTYSAKSALVVSSPGRTPEEDAVLAVGYAMLFNDPATVARLRAATSIPDDVGFEAGTAAASPIVTIEALAGSPTVAQDAAQVMAEAFRDDMNAARQKESDETVADLQRKIDEIRARTGPGAATDPAIGALQESIDNVQYNSTTNQLRDLQMRVGVVRKSSKRALTLMLGLGGGLLAGALCAFALAALSNRLKSPADVREKTGIDPLAVLPGSGSGEAGLRDERLRTLAGIIDARSTSSPWVLVVTDARGVRGARQVAEGLAMLSAQHGRRTVLVLADADPHNDAELNLRAGFYDALRDSRIAAALVNQGPMDSLSVLTAGSVEADHGSLLTRDRFEAVLDRLRVGAEVVIVAAPAMDEPGAPIICAAANMTVLVVSKKVSRVADVVSAGETLNAVGANVLGAVLLEDKVARRPSTPVRSGSPARHRSWVGEAVSA